MDGGDLPAVKLDKFKDPLVKFEKQFPFHRMHIASFRQVIYNFGKDKFAISDLKARLPGSLWEQALKPGSPTMTLLESLPGSEKNDSDPLETLVDTTSMLLLSIIWCGGDFDDKAEALFQCLNPPGQSQEGISANDKEWDLVFDTMCYLATVFTVDQAMQQGINTKSYDEDLTKRGIKGMRISEIEDPPAHMGFIMQVFGYESRLDRDAFFATVIDKNCNWVFQANKIRERLVPFLDEGVLDEVEA
uniref:Uncharacterized protein n=1 Tax=Strombidium inclinatum TaxID=197538 RepID=A0A7S3IFY6_9SPIT|mmetsp:Transcript_13257/g.20735  ORF Transcript_13257/g.20735 Transcript_13257/m.20735 type:complete len:246 (+) Transcript_13257:52-789(+)